MKRKQKNRYLLMISMILLLVISIGYAAVSTTLSISGTANIAATSWKVYFTNIQTTTGSVTASSEPTITGTDTTTLSYTVALENPGDFYEFTVDVVNAGTINAKIAENGVTKGGVSTANDTYVNYTVTYADTNGTEISDGDKLSKSGQTIDGIGSTRKIKVRVEFDPSVTSEQLDAMSDDITLNLTFGLNYVQD